jgi:L-ascorbate metabolism protein UlaG (beta-lactamase superfamily)
VFVELTYYGGNCLRIVTKKAQIVVDDNLKQLGLKFITKPADIALRTSKDVPEHEARIKVDMPGEYETAGVVIHGVAARAHMDEEGKHSATIFTIEADGTRVAILGHIFPDLNEDQIEQIGMVDIAVVPVGGHGYTMDGVGALKIIKEIEPKIVIPTHYADKALNYEVPQAELADALKGLGMEASETVDKYKYKALEGSDSTKLVVINRQ